MENDVMDIKNQERYKELCDDVECYRSARTNAVPVSGSSSGSAPRVVSPRQMHSGSEPPSDVSIVKIKENEMMDASQTFLRLPRYVISGSGVEQQDSERDMVLYKRDACGAEINFITEKVIEGAHEGFIYGQPGTGKSSTALFVGFFLRKLWKVVWIHTTPTVSRASVFVIQGDTVSKFRILRTEIHFHSLPYLSQGGQCLVILDSVNIADLHDIEIYGRAGDWVEQDAGNRRLLRISSNGGPSSLPRELQDKTMLHGVGSWSLDEYRAAVKDDDFWASVSATLLEEGQEPHPTKEVRAEIVENKFEYAGTCARFMFVYSVAQIKEKVNLAIRTQDVRIDGPSGLFNKNTKHHLLSSSLVGDPPVQTYTGFVSRYATRAIGGASRPYAIRSLISCPIYHLNGSVKGWLFEALFFACTAEADGVILYAKMANSRSPRTKVVWKVSSAVLEFSSTMFDHKDSPEIPYDTWLMPDNPRQPGYDAVILLRQTKTIRFVQTTTCGTHDLKMAALTDLVVRLKNKKYEIDSAEICFVIPDDGNAQHFKIGPITGFQAFHELFPSSWTAKEKEVRAKLKIFHLQF
jgi:hypothetical protein